MDFSLFFQNNFKMFLPEFFLATSILVITLHGSLIATSKVLGFPLLLKSFNKMSILILGLTLILVNNNSASFLIVFSSSFIFDLLTLNVKQFVLFSAILCLFISEQSLKLGQINQFEYFILILCSILGLLFLTSSFDLLSLYLAIEMQSLCFYVLAAAKKDSSFSTEAGLKYFIIGSFSSGLLLLGISFLYGCTGTTHFDNFSLLFSETNTSYLVSTSLIEKALLCIIIAFFFKIAAAPFHMWSPDVYEGSPISSTIFFAILPKIVLFSTFLRLFQTCFSYFGETLLLFSICSALCSVIIGSFVALKQKKLKRLLAYSSISHVGYLLLAFSCNSLEGSQSLFFYLIIYMLTSFAIWSVVLSLNTSTNLEKSKTLIDLASLSTVNPLLAFTALIAFFSLAGVPPLAGFFAKLEIFVNCLGSSLFFASLIAILSSVISSFYYIRLVKTIYFEKVSDNGFKFAVSRSCSLILCFSMFFLFFLFFNPSLLFLQTHKMALCLF